MNLKNFFKAIIFQLKKTNAFKNIFITHNAFGIFSINSHINQHTKLPKISYSTIEKAIKASQKMSEKKNCHFSVYKCAYCNGYHIGRNKENK